MSTLYKAIHRLLFLTAMLVNSVSLVAQNPTLDSLENVLETHQTKDSTRVKLLSEVAYNLRRIDLDRSCECAAEANALAEELSYKKGIATSFNALANCFYLRSDYKEAFNFFEKSEKLHLETGDQAGLSFSLNGTGMAHLRQGNYPAALDYIQRALSIGEKAGDKTRISFSTYNIGNCYSLLGEYSMALDYYQRSLEMSRELKKKDFISVTLRDMGQAYTMLNKYDEARECFESSMRIMEEENDQKGISFTMITLGILNEKQGRLDEAFKYFTEAAAISKKSGFKHNLCDSYTCLSDIYIGRREYSKALNYALSSLLIAKELNILPEQSDIYEQLSRIYEATGDYKKAYQSHQAFKELNDSVFNEESIRTVANLKNSFHYEKEKQKAAFEQQQKDAVLQAEAKWQRMVRNFFIIAFIVTFILVLVVVRISIQRKKANETLSLQNDEIEKTSRRLTQKNEEISLKNKELKNQSSKLENALGDLQKAQSQLVQSEKMASVGVLTAGIAHEINNPLNFIHGGKSALDRYVKKNLKEHQEKLKPLLDTIDVGIKRVTGIVLSINRFSREGGGKNENCDIHLILENCLLMLQNQFKSRVKIKKSYTEEAFRLFGQEGDLHQVFINVLANAIQSIEKGGTVSISTEVVGENLEVKISDTGCGISRQNLNRVTNPFFTTRDPGKGTGLGMSIAYNIIKDHLGKIRYESEEGVGTTAIVTLPVIKTTVEV